jgi:CHAT domain-containing protein
LYAAWIDNKQKLGKSYSGKLNLSSEEQKSLEEAINLQEKKLSDFSGAIAKKETALSDAQIMKLLKKEQAAIEFITYKRKEDQKEMLCAILLKADQKEPNIVPLCSNDFLLQLKGKSNGNTVDFVASLYGTKENNSIELYNSIWKPLEANLTNVKEIYYSPSGALHKVAFSSLRNNDGVYLSERFVLHQLGATSALANQTGSSIAFKNNRFLIMGGVNYSIEEKKNTIWDYLPGTQTETEKITAIAKKSGMQAMYYSGKNATEERIKSSSEEEVPELIHVATHGFFYDNPEEVIKNRRG